MTKLSVCLGLGLLFAGGMTACVGAYRSAQAQTLAADALTAERVDFADIRSLPAPNRFNTAGTAYRSEGRWIASPDLSKPTTLNDRPNLILAKIQDRMTFALRPRPREPRN